MNFLVVCTRSMMGFEGSEYVDKYFGRDTDTGTGCVVFLMYMLRLWGGRIGGEGIEEQSWLWISDFSSLLQGSGSFLEVLLLLVCSLLLFSSVNSANWRGMRA